MRAAIPLTKAHSRAQVTKHFVKVLCGGSAARLVGLPAVLCSLGGDDARNP
jgi:hypothetical protein